VLHLAYFEVERGWLTLRGRVVLERHEQLNDRVCTHLLPETSLQVAQAATRSLSVWIWTISPFFVVALYSLVSRLIHPE